MIEHLMKSRPIIATPPIVDQAAIGQGITPASVPSDYRANTAVQLPPVPRATTANTSTLEAKMATLPSPPVPRAVAPAPLSLGSDESHLVSEFVLTGCEVACKRCLGRWYVERVFSDGDVVLSCYTCRGSVTGELFPGLADDRRTEKRREREAEDAAIAGDAT